MKVIHSITSSEIYLRVSSFLSRFNFDIIDSATDAKCSLMYPTDHRFNISVKIISSFESKSKTFFKESTEVSFSSQENSELCTDNHQRSLDLCFYDKIDLGYFYNDITAKLLGHLVFIVHYKPPHSL